MNFVLADPSESNKTRVLPVSWVWCAFPSNISSCRGLGACSLYHRSWWPVLDSCLEFKILNYVNRLFTIYFPRDSVNLYMTGHIQYISFIIIYCIPTMIPSLKPIIYINILYYTRFTSQHRHGYSRNSVERDGVMIHHGWNCLQFDIERT